MAAWFGAIGVRTMILSYWIEYTQPTPRGIAMPVTRLLPTPESADLIKLVRDIADRELAPRVDRAEAEAEFPRDVFRTLGAAGLLSLPYPEEYGGGCQPYEVYLQVLEEIGAVWASIGVGISVHVLSCFGLAQFGTAEQKEEWLPAMLGGDLLGAYCLSEPHAGSDPAAMTTKAVRDGDDYVITGAKAWTTHGGYADLRPAASPSKENTSSSASFRSLPTWTGVVAVPRVATA